MKGLTSTKKPRGNYGTPVSYSRQSPYLAKRTTRKSGPKA